MATARVPTAPNAPAARAIQPDAWRKEADTWLGTPHKLGGLDRRGVDCSGLTLKLHKAVAGISLPHNAAEQFSLGVPVATSRLAAGDLVFFSERGKGVFHVGLSLGGDRFVHASTSRGVIISNLRQAYYASRFCGAKRILR
jgi:cell wall-associated NlpC family hydrolase